MSGRKRFASDMTYVPDDISDTDSSSDSDSEYIDDIYSGTDENFSDSSVDSDESENSFSIQNARQWCKIDMQNIPPAPASFPFIGNPGPNFTMADDATVLDYFELFFDDVMLQIIVKETNRYAQQYMNKAVPKERSRWKKWTDTDEKELRLFFSVLFLQGIVKKPKQEYYWSKRHILQTPIFHQVIQKDRFILLMKFLHFTNNEEFDKDNHPWPKLNKIYDIMEHLRNKFRNLYIPDKNLSIDESLMRFKGRLSWKMFIAKKRARFGLKFFVVCEVGTGYIADFLIYTGNGTVYNPKFAKYPVSTKIVLHLMDRFLGQGYCVTMDNYYMSPQLADILISERTDLYGTVNKMRKDLPPNFAKEKIPKGDVLAYQRGKVMALKWQDKKSVFLMSTVHNASSRLVKCKSKKTVLKPIVVCDYNNTMGGVDLCDQEMSYYPTLRKQQGKYYIKIFRQFMDQSLWNAYILYKKDNPLQNITLLDFRLQIIELSIQKYSDRNSSAHSSRCSSTLNPMRLTARHFASHIPPNPIKKEPRRQCAVCCSKKTESGKKIRKETRIWCKDCEVGLCLEPCFEIYHTKLHF
ncbi:PiggyBac transposable element-derived protein 4 [Araneus ventricosus]|uniref:PiggyBac transposable element-derived protein 4 n=1 Tax=Araneus ventricosus TaxID=182803 RepID=A0A4Y2DXR0_ARAVE|nr:PiggyBac transposable element-derived protein 4 [Araneus ventricosus]